MSAIQTEVFEAFRAIDVPEDKALRAAAALTAALARTDDETRALSPLANSLQLEIESSFIGLESPRRLQECRYCSRTAFGKRDGDLETIRKDMASIKGDTAGVRIDLATVKGDVSLLKWMVGLAITLDLTVLAKLFSH